MRECVHTQVGVGTMEPGSGPFLVTRREDGYGDVIALEVGQRCTLGRANTNRVVLRDELCSREHAEVFFAEARWRLRDLKSLNKTRVNGEAIDEWELVSGDEFMVGRTRFLYVNHLDELPNVSLPNAGETVSIKKRLTESRFLTPHPHEIIAPEPAADRGPRRNMVEQLSALCRLGLDIGTAADHTELANVVLEGLLKAVRAEVGAFLTVKEGREIEVTSVRPVDPNRRTYSPVSEFVTNEVMSTKEAVLADDVSHDRYLSQRDSITSLGATSLICAPVEHEGKVLALIHLYSVDPHRSLGNDDLEFTLAVAKHVGIVLARVQRQDSLEADNRELRHILKVESELIGESAPVRQLHDQIARVATTNATVLIRGESGAGKELVARAIHFSSGRRKGPFVCLNCAAITETLLESELFGHERGAFTGATDKKIGKFEAAHQGTIFLDEIGEMAVNTQAKLLRVLEGHPFERVGGGTPIRVEVRVVAATNQPLEKAIQESRFRRDLFYRLQVVEIRVPSLREHRDDVPILADHFLKRFVKETARKIRGFTPAAMDKMVQYNWPGNVRELRNVIERAVALGKGPLLDIGDIWLSALEISGAALESTEVFEPLPLDEVEKRHILKTLDHTDWNKSQAAGLLKIERSTLDRKIKGYGLKKEDERGA